MTVTLPWAPWNGPKPLRRTKHGTATEVGGIFSQITHRSAGWRDTVVGSIADSMRGQTFGRIAKSCDKAERELACPGEVFLGTSSRNDAVAWQVQSGLSWSGWARRRRAFVRALPWRVQVPHGRAAMSEIHAMQDEVYNATPSVNISARAHGRC